MNGGHGFQSNSLAPAPYGGYSQGPMHSHMPMQPPNPHQFPGQHLMPPSVAQHQHSMHPHQAMQQAMMLQRNNPASMQQPPAPPPNGGFSPHPNAFPQAAHQARHNGTAHHSMPPMPQSFPYSGMPTMQQQPGNPGAFPPPMNFTAPLPPQQQYSSPVGAYSDPNMNDPNTMYGSWSGDASDSPNRGAPNAMRRGGRKP
jgi:hypothetical protein